MFLPSQGGAHPPNYTMSKVTLPNAYPISSIFSNHPLLRSRAQRHCEMVKALPRRCSGRFAHGTRNPWQGMPSEKHRLCQNAAKYDFSQGSPAGALAPGRHPAPEKPGPLSSGSEADAQSRSNPSRRMNLTHRQKAHPPPAAQAAANIKTGKTAKAV